MQNPLTLSEDKWKSSSGIIRNGKGFQNKSQFRTIAPKMVPKVITSGVVSCLPPVLPEQTNSISSASSKPLIMPTQNYTLMQVAGCEGTFSLVALPHITPALAAQRIQQSNVSPPENLKLPIPRYQSVKNKLLIDKKTIQTSSSSAHNKISSKVQTSTQTPAMTTSTGDLPDAHSTTDKLFIDKKTIQTSSSRTHNKIPSKVQISSQTPAMTTSTGDLPEVHSITDSSEQVILIDHGSTEITVGTLLSENNCVESGSPLLNKTETAEDSISGPSVIKECLSKPVNPSNPVKMSLHSMKSTVEATKGSLITSEKLKEKLVNSANSVTVLSPAIFGNEVQLTQSAPKGKLPILPYSRMKNAMFCKSKQNSNTVAASTPGRRPECEKIPPLVKTFNVSTRVYDKLLAISFAQISKQAPRENTFSPVTKLDVDNLKKLNGVASKRRGRKRRTPDDILAFQTKRRKCIINKFREGKERVKVESKGSRAESVKKYRSIRPKPVVMQALAPLTSAAIIETQTPDCIEQDIFLNDALPNKYLSCKQSGGTPAKQSDLCRNLFSAISKPWHKCHVCNYNFQFKHHLQDHMNTHTNRRPYSCRICLKAYVHSGSLSTHMKLHHNEGRLKKLVCCEFCAKVFGHARVYFGHLKEVHRVVISIEPSTGEQQLQDALKNRDINIKGAEETVERGNKCNFEDLFQSQAEVKLQIKCGRCQFTAQSFAEMKFHLLCFHGEELPGRIKEGILQGGKGAQEELIKHAAHFWKQRKERRNPVKRGTCEEEFYAFPKLKRQIYLHQNNFDTLTKSEVIPSSNSEPGKELQNFGCATQNKKIQIWCKADYNCILCKQVFGRKEGLFSHWQNHHNCEDPSVLWTIFNSFSKEGVIELSNNAEK
ncbi:zinc finger protein 438 isoform X2 [Chelonoidis abingdonii]|uniref:zinc finger protein 438 isoform X2 n=1 Tax=Chelonoidis abingdonii TaxID=106734 RepID=UPI0013F1E6E9|nr:zinc finger protein 438 isoform X2 [Chelonoidis abingdonii]